MTCEELGRYENYPRPLRFVNGKLARYHSDKKHVMIWDPEHGDEGAWVLEHRYVFEKAYGVKLATADKIHHDFDIRADDNTDETKLTKRTNSEHAKIHNAEIQRRLAAFLEYERRYGPLGEESA